MTLIERARGFLDAANLSDQWVNQMQSRALLLEAHHTTHIEGTALTLDQAEKIWNGEEVEGASQDDRIELLNYRRAFDFVSQYMSSDGPITEGLIREIHSRLLSTLLLYRAGYDFKQLFSLSEFYDRVQPQFYDAIQNVRDCGMDITGWLEFFVNGLATQMVEIQVKGTEAIRVDVLALEKSLNERQLVGLRFLVQHRSLDIAQFKKLNSAVSRRTLQRDLSDLEEKQIIYSLGSTNNKVYALADEILVNLAKKHPENL